MLIPTEDNRFFEKAIPTFNSNKRSQTSSILDKSGIFIKRIFKRRGG